MKPPSSFLDTIDAVDTFRLISGRKMPDFSFGGDGHVRMADVTDPTLAARSASGIDASDVLQLLLDRQERSRAEIARALSLSRSTIALRLDALKAAGLLRAASQIASEGGRPTTRIALNDRVRSVAAIELGHSSSRVSLGDLSADLLRTVELPVAHTEDFEHILNNALDALTTMLDEIAGIGPLAGITLGLPLSATLGSVTLQTPSGRAGWMGFPVKEWLEERLNVPVQVENDVNLMTLGEQLERNDAPDLMLLHAGEGIGVGVVAAGVLVRGNTGQAGEIAHVPAIRRAEEPCLCGNVGCLSAVASVPGILKRLRAEGVDVASFDDLMTRVTNGDSVVAQTLRQAGRDVGDVMVYAISATNPQYLIVGGALAVAGDHFVAGVREALFRYGAPALTEGLHVVRSSHPFGAGTSGALRLAARDVLDNGALFELLEQPLAS